MARIPIPCEEKEENTAGFGLRLKSFVGFRREMEKCPGRRQFRTAVVTLGLFALVVYSTDVFDSVDSETGYQCCPCRTQGHGSYGLGAADQVLPGKSIIAPQLPEENNDPNTEGKNLPRGYFQGAGE